jgi:hypothetical protein
MNTIVISRDIGTKYIDPQRDTWAERSILISASGQVHDRGLVFLLLRLDSCDDLLHPMAVDWVAVSGQRVPYADRVWHEAS